MNKKICTICKKELDETDFCFKNKAKNLKHTACKICSRKQVNKHYLSNKEYYAKRNEVRKKKLLTESREKTFEYLKTHPCVDCGEKNPICLHFDHLRDKSFGISPAKFTKSWTQIDNEIKKYEIRFANCNSINSMKERNTWIYQKSKAEGFIE